MNISFGPSRKVKSSEVEQRAKPQDNQRVLNKIGQRENEAAATAAAATTVPPPPARSAC